jgi:hypothetical protein
VNDRRLFFAAVVITLLVQAPVVNGEFLFYDDARFIVRNESIESLSNTLRFFHDLETTASTDAPTKDIYRPLRTFTYAVLTHVSGKDARAFHLASLLFHALTAGVLALVVRRSGVGIGASLAGALVWGVHPVTVESTAWVCSLGDVMCGFFGVLSLLAHIGRRRALALVLLAVALLAKEAAVVVPGLWLAWDYFLRREETKPAALRGAVPGLALVLVFLAVRGAVIGAGMSQLDGPLGGSHANAVRTMFAGFGFYVSTILFPFGSTFDARVPIQTSLSGGVVLGFLLFAGVGAATVFGTTRTRLGAAWFLLALVPASNVIIPLKIPTADRFLYLPLMGAAFVVGEVCERWPRPAKMVVPVALLLLASVTAFVRIGDWRDDAALLATWRRVNPKSRRVLWAEASYHAKTALTAMRKGHGTVARDHYLAANRLYAQLVKNVRGQQRVPIQVWMEAGELALGWAEFTEAIDRQEEFVRAYTDALTWFGLALRRQEAGMGRVVEEEMIRAATMVARVATRLADMRNPEIDRTIKAGMDALQLLRREFGVDTDLEMARLLLAYSVRIRAREPARARQGFTQVLSVLDAFEERGVEGLTFWRAQCVYYTAFLTDAEYDRAGVRRSYDLYMKAAAEIPEFRYWALYHAARSKCAEGRIFHDQEAIALGKQVLDDLEAEAKKRRIGLPADLRLRIQSERSGCVARG